MFVPLIPTEEDKELEKGLAKELENQYNISEKVNNLLSFFKVPFKDSINDSVEDFKITYKKLKG